MTNKRRNVRLTKQLRNGLSRKGLADKVNGLFSIHICLSLQAVRLHRGMPHVGNEMPLHRREEPEEGTGLKHPLAFSQEPGHRPQGRGRGRRLRCCNRHGRRKTGPLERQNQPLSRSLTPQN
jgi:hypothetical protein